MLRPPTRCSTFMVLDFIRVPPPAARTITVRLLKPRSATVTAATPVRTFRLRKAAFDQALRMRPEIAAGVITELVRRLRESHEPPPAR